MCVTVKSAEVSPPGPKRASRSPFAEHSFTLKSGLKALSLNLQDPFPVRIISFTEIPLNSSFMPLTGPGLQFNFPSVASLKYYPRNEIRAPEYRVWSRCRETDGDMA